MKKDYHHIQMSKKRLGGSELTKGPQVALRDMRLNPALAVSLAFPLSALPCGLSAMAGTSAVKITGPLTFSWLGSSLLLLWTPAGNA